MVMIFVTWAADLLPKPSAQDRTLFLTARSVSENVIPTQSSWTCRVIHVAERFLSFKGCWFLLRQPEKCSVFESSHSWPSCFSLNPASAFLSFLLPLSLSFVPFLPFNGASPRPSNHYLPNLWPETTWHFPGMAGIYRPPKRHLWHLLTWAA